MWKPVRIAGGRIEVSEDGQVRSLPSKTHHGQILSQNVTTNGYWFLTNRLTGKKLKMILVHRIVAMEFVPNPDNLPQVNHKDGNKLNNHYTNLEWVTPSGNTKHAHDHNLIRVIHGEEHNWSKITKDQAQEIIDKYRTGKYSQRQLAKEYGLIQQSISLIVRGVNWKRSLV